MLKSVFAAALLALFSFHLAPHAFAREDLIQFEGKTIREIRFDGLKRIEKEAVTEKISSKKGSRLQGTQIRADLQALFGMGFFDDIEVTGDPDGEGVVIQYRFRERQVISAIEFEGNEQIPASDLREVIKVKEWSILDLNKVREDIGLLQKNYEDKGFYLAKITFKVERVNDEEVKLTFVVNDYDKVQIRKITFLNNKVFSDEQLKAALGETREGGFLAGLSGSGNFKESAFKQDLQRLTYWYLDHGYVKFRYDNPVITVSDDKRYLYITIYVEEGEPYSVDKITFSGDLLFTIEELESELKLKAGQLFRISERNDDIQRLTEKYQDLGYAFVNVVPRMENQRDDTHQLDLNYHFEKGNLVHFGKITILGNTKTHDKVVRRELRIKEGELYNGTNLRLSKERVERLGYFAPGEVQFNTVPPKGRDDLLDVQVVIKERSTGTVTLGAGYGSVQKFFFTTTISEINLLGRGQNLSFQATYATDRRTRSFNLGFTEPYTFDSLWSTGADVFFLNLPIPSRYSTRRLGFNLRAGHPISYYDDLYGYLTYKNEGMTIYEKADPTIDSRLDEGVLSSVVFSLVRDKRNNRFETTAGNYQNASLETAGVGGDKKFLKWSLNNRVYQRIVGDLIFRNSTELDEIRKIDSRGIPPSEKFYLGGPNNMKGYEFYSLGPKYINPNGYVEPVGGSVQMYSLFELEYPLIREAGLKYALFYDVGNAFQRWPGTSGENFTLRQDWGMGLRWFSPIGPLRFEWGFPIAARSGDSSPVFNFFIGPPF